LTATGKTALNSGRPDANQWMVQACNELEEAAVSGCDIGVLEKILERRLKELGRPLLEEAVQKLADRQPLVCPRCNCKLNAERHQRERTISSVFGKVPFKRSYGFCPDCKEHFYPADQVMGLQERAPASPRVQEISSLAVLKSPAGKAQEDVRRMTGLDLGQATIHREARRQGERALRIREADVALSNTIKGVKTLSERAKLPESAFTLVIEIDAWHIRERDHWGQTKKLRKKGEDVSRWHWVYTGTVFRLDHRGKTNSGRPVISERGYVATRQGTEALEKQLYAEALQRGLLQADSVLVLADGATWIWNIAKDRFKDAVHRVDLWHVTERLWAIANDLYGHNTPEARKWVQPLLSWLKRRKDGALDVIETLTDIHSQIKGLTRKQRKMLGKEIGYFNEHKDRMDYKNGKALDQPLGSGAMESTCAQYQCRFKRTGQFWSLEGDEALLALQTLYWNERWRLLFPHDKQQE